MVLPTNLNASKIDLSNQKLNSIPEAIFRYRNLQKLNLANNRIDSIPKDISKLKRLEVLNLADNRINNLFAKFFDVKHLKTLIINNNKIRNIPKQLSNLVSLRTLSISSNELTKIPESIYNLPALRKLNVSSNSISIIDSKLLYHKTIEYLWLNNLPISSFPEMITSNEVELVKNIYCFSNIANNVNVKDQTYLELSKHGGNCKKLYIELCGGQKRETDKDQIQLPIKTHSSLKSNKIAKETTIDKNKIFVSYSHKDQIWLERVQSAIKSMKLSGINIDLWSDKKIKTSQVWREEIKKALESSYAAILLISTDFLASDFIVSEELPTLLKNAENNRTKIINLIIKPSRIKHIESIVRYRAVNDLSKPLCKIPEYEQEEILVKLTEDIEDLL